MRKLLNLHILYRLFRDTLTLLKEVGLDYLFIHVTGCVALRNKEFHLKPTLLAFILFGYAFDSRCSFLSMLDRLGSGLSLSQFAKLKGFP